MLAGENDLLWDYSEGAPSSSPDNGLYYNNKFADAAGSKNGLKGIKLNSSGFCAFKKAAVAGKLKLSFGPREGTNATYVEVWNCTWGADGKTPAKGDTKIATTGSLTEYGTQIVELTAEQNDIFIWRGESNSTETGLQIIEFKENVARTFTNFKVDFRKSEPEWVLPTSKPDNVTLTNCAFHDAQHGILGGTITVVVDGPVKFTLGTCQFSSKTIVVKKDGTKIAEISNSGTCDNQYPEYNQFMTYTYPGEAGTLTFELGNPVYLPYLFAEACDVAPCTITFKDQNGNVLGKVETIEGATLESIPYTEADLPAIDENEAFRGWFYTNGKKAKKGDPIGGNTTISAKVTPKEKATVGSVQVYDFANTTFYPEDHETVTVTGGQYHNNHGWIFSNGHSFSVQVAGNAVVVLSVCEYSAADGTWVPTDAEDNTLAAVPAYSAADAGEVSLQYSGAATTLTFTLNASGSCYLHKVSVYNVENFLEKDATTGYFLVPSGDAAAFILALAQAEAGDKIFLPNGLYDLGETVLTTISKNNISIIGQSMKGVTIKNAPDVKTESIDKTATLRIAKNVSGTYLQDLTIQNALDYYSVSTGRAVALWDQGTKTVCKNVRLLSHQDTYYSNLQKAVKYFEDCEIHGTVDFICGDGSVYFKNNLLYCEKRQNDGKGTDALTASNADALDHGYVFEGCTIKSECPVVSLGRAWNNTPQTAFLNTLVDYSAGNFSFSDDEGKIQRWTKELMNKGAWPQFVEYNTHLANGTVLTPDHNQVTFIDKKDGNVTQTLETVISAEGAALRTMENTLGDWAATAANDAKQAECEKEAEQFEADAIYLAEAEGEPAILFKGSDFYTKVAVYNGVNYKIRKANARGGFGKSADDQGQATFGPSAIEPSNAQKTLCNGQLIIFRDGKQYNAIGAQL